jgi:hypothetical protein
MVGGTGPPFRCVGTYKITELALVDTCRHTTFIFSPGVICARRRLLSSSRASLLSLSRVRKPGPRARRSELPKAYLRLFLLISTGGSFLAASVDLRSYDQGRFARIAGEVLRTALSFPSPDGGKIPRKPSSFPHPPRSSGIRQFLEGCSFVAGGRLEQPTLCPSERTF